MDNLLKIACLNVRSLTAHFANFKNIVLLNDYDVIGINESWLTNSVPNQLIDIPGYIFTRVDRQGRGGGVGVYLKNTIRFKTLNVPGTIEQVWLQLTILNFK